VDTRRPAWAALLDALALEQYNRVIKIVEAIQRRKSAEREMPPLGRVVGLGSKDRFNKPQKPMNATPSSAFTCAS
jgi:hypothetical protein